MAGLEDLEGMAAEYALGTLDAGERRLVDQAIVNDPKVLAAVQRWESILAPLALALEPAPAPAAVRPRVMAAIARQPAGAGEIIRFRSMARRWRMAAIGSWALAAAAAGIALLVPPAVHEQQRYVAVLQSEGPGPAFIASIDVGAGTISVRPVSASAPAGQAYELWAVGGGRDKPQSLGVINADFKVPASKLGSLDQGRLNETVFAVSLEPPGGSPTGQPTGPVVFTGKLVATE